MRQFTSFILIFFASTLLALGERPNVVIILSDDQGPADYGFMDHPILKTPHLDKLADKSRVYERAYVTSPLCRPSLASIVTGLYPHQHGVVGNDVSPARKLERDAEDRPVRDAFHRRSSLVKLLTEAGYDSFQTGKWWEGSFADGGFSEGMTHGDPQKGGRHGDLGLEIGRDGMQPIEDFLDRTKENENPFLLWYAPFLPHTPHNAPDKWKARFADLDLAPDLVEYYAMVEWFDDTCGQLLDSLETRGLTENTIIVYLCDNGWTAPSASLIDAPDGWWPSYAPKSKGSPYEGGIRTPIMISLPGQIEPERITDSIASSIDLFPTLVKLCDLKAPASLPGIDLLSQDRTTTLGASWSIHNMTPGDPMDTLQYAWFIDGDWKLLRRYDGSDTTKYRSIHEWDREQIQLFNLAKDPNETTNLATDEYRRVMIMSGEIHRFITPETP